MSEDLSLDPGGEEFRRAVSAEVSRQVAALLPTLREQVAKAPSTPAGTVDKDFAESLAVAIAQLSDQGTGRGRRVAPEVLRAREDARKRLVALVAETRATVEKHRRNEDDAAAREATPAYNLRHKVHIAEVLIDPVYIDPQSKQHRQQEIGWLGIPNESMVPINDAARRIYAEFAASIGTLAPEDDKSDRRGLAVTAGGLVIRGGSLATRPADVLKPPSAEETMEGAGLTVRGGGRFQASQQKSKEVRVLGTVMAPARVGA